VFLLARRLLIGKRATKQFKLKANQMSKNEINKYLCAILTTLNEVEFAPESMIYLAIGADMGKWETLKYMLVSARLATSEDSAMRITPRGRELAEKINAMVAA
jgi:hypothetical protein